VSIEAREIPETKEILRVTDLQKYFPVKGGGLGILSRTVAQVKAVDGISLNLNEGETLGLVGESGCGKSTAGRTILRLLTPTAGKIVVDGEDITKLSSKSLIPFRRKAQIIFQDPYNALNPRHTVGTATRTSSPAASDSASVSPAPSRCAPSSSSVTSPCPPSTCRSRRRS